MNINKMMDKLDLFFDQSKKKQAKKHRKLLKIIEKLKVKKAMLKKELIKEARNGENSNKYRDMLKQYKVVVKLILKAKKQDAS